MEVREDEILRGLTLGKSKDIVEATNNVLTKTIETWLQQSIERSKQIIDEATGRPSATGASLRPEITANKAGAIIKLIADDNAEFIDKGVNAVGTNNQGSPYSFRTPYPNKYMARAIREWIPTKGYTLPDGFNSYDSFSYAIAANVKKRGVEATGFISDVFNDEAIEELGKAISKALGEQYKIVLNDLGK